jgi:RNA polymerase sigma factor (sigma-70 family)
MNREGLEERLVDVRQDVVRFVHKNAGFALRFETSDDLAQGIFVRALDRGAGLNAADEKAFFAWLYSVARSYLSDRRRHWSALKRGSGDLLRLSGTSDATTDPRAVGEPAADLTGPSTFASRREQLVLAVRALDLLLERDRSLVRGFCDGVSIQEQAQRLELEYDAARRARARALERFRRAFRAIQK